MCNDAEFTNLAQVTCEQLEGSIVLTAGLILQTAISTAENLGYTAPELGDKMREECPGVMDAIENIGDEQEARENLINEVTLDLRRCSDDGASGIVTNNSSVRVDIFIDVEYLSDSVEYLSDSGVLLDTGFASVSGLRPGQTGEWDSFFSGDLDRCRAEISSVFED